MSAHALFGNELFARPMRLIYVDEAGTSANEPVSIVVGIVINGDTQYRPVYNRVNSVLRKVPEKYRKDFIFHATSIWSSPKYRDKREDGTDEWSREDRLAILKEMMAIPRQLHSPIAVGAVSRDFPVPKEMDMRPEQYHHALAFVICVTQADLLISNYGGATETAVVVAEDIPEMRQTIRTAIVEFSKEPHLVVDYIHQGVPGRLRLQVTRVLDTVHFVEKPQARVLAIADACAFGLRRYMSKQTTGEEFARAMLEQDPRRFHIPQVPDIDGEFGALLWKAPTNLGPISVTFGEPWI